MRDFLHDYCRYLAAWYLPFLRTRYGAEYGRMQASLAEARVRTMYLFGIRLFRLYECGKISVVFLFGMFPTLLFYGTGAKTCVYLGRLELWKIRRGGKLQMPDDAFFMNTRTGGRSRLFYAVGSREKSREGAGVPRVSASLLAALLKMRDCPYEIVPVRSGEDSPGFFTAFDGVRSRFPFLEVTGEDGPALFSEGDVLLFPVPDLRQVESQYHVLKFLQKKGVIVCFVLHDIIVMRHPEFFDAALHEEMRKWLGYVSRFSGMLAVSRASEEDYLLWRKENRMAGGGAFFTSWFHLGSDIRTPVSSRGVPEGGGELLEALKRRITFLEVSTIEPRKGHRQALAAFERLWDKGVDVNFVIVGRRGWKMDDFLCRLEGHAERGRRLFWLSDVSDEFLDCLYEASSAVLMPSEAEGFGLAVVEGARHGRPLILRDLPVFREIAGEGATYFSGLAPEDLSNCLEAWLKKHEEGTLPSPGKIRILSWEESARMLLAALPAGEGRA